MRLLWAVTQLIGVNSVKFLGLSKRLRVVVSIKGESDSRVTHVCPLVAEQIAEKVEYRARLRPAVSLQLGLVASACRESPIKSWLEAAKWLRR